MLRQSLLAFTLALLCNSSIAQNNVTFRVNMRVKILEGTFQPLSGDRVRVAGSFNGWNSNADTLLDSDMDSIYTKSVQLAEGSSILYKFYKTPRSGLDWENGPNRTYTVPPGGGIVPLVWFDDDSIVSTPVSGTITFRVNMAAFMNVGWFLPAVDSMKVYSGIGSLRMVPDPMSTFYRASFVYSGIGLDLPYRYYIKMDSASAVIRFPGWMLNRDGMQFEHPYFRGDANRNLAGAWNMNDYISDVHPEWTMNNTSDTCRVTVRVNMAPATRHSTPFNPTADTLFLVWKDALWRSAQEANQGTFFHQLRMRRQSPTDSIWSVNFRVKGKSHAGLMYVYTYTKPDGSLVEEGGGLGIQNPFRARMLQRLSPNLFPPTYSAPLDTWQKNSPMPVEPPPYPLSVEEYREGILPNSFVLHQNYPNPFNPSTRIRYSLPEQARVTLRVYNILGQQVAELVNQEQGRGNYIALFEGDNLASGVYFYRLSAWSLSSGFSETKRMIFMR
jgi:hypothetical protein